MTIFHKRCKVFNILKFSPPLPYMQSRHVQWELNLDLCSDSNIFYKCTMYLFRVIREHECEQKLVYVQSGVENMTKARLKMNASQRKWTYVAWKMIKMKIVNFLILHPVARVYWRDKIFFYCLAQHFILTLKVIYCFHIFNYMFRPTRGHLRVIIFILKAIYYCMF